MRIFIIFLVCSVLNTTYSSADSSNGPRSKKKQLIERADSIFFAENFSESLELYDRILEDFPSNHYVQYHRFVAYHLSQGRGGDVKEIYEYEENEGHVDKFYNYWLGRIHFLRYEFDVAKEHFQAFLDMKAYRSREIKLETEEFLKKIEKAKPYHDNPDDYQIIPLSAPINSEYADVSPAFFGGHDELLFLSSRPNEDRSQDGNKDFKIFHSYKENKDWNAPSVLNRLGVFDQENAKIEVVNQDGKLFMFLDGQEGGLYYSEPTADNWTYPVKFDSKINRKSIDAHFFINDAEDHILFSADNGGYRLDIFESYFDNENQSWSAPKSLQGQINSRFNDDSPFMSHDGKYLYFSSNRRASMGGYDIFRSTYDEETKTWSMAENLGFPINTIDDEINFQLNEDNISGFFSSNRLHSLGDYDIYYFHEYDKVLANGVVTDRTTGEALSNVKIEFHPIEYTDEFFHAYTNENGAYKVQVLEDEEYIVQFSINDQVISADKVRSVSGQLNRSFKTDFQLNKPTSEYVKTDYTKLYQGSESAEREYASLDMIGSKFRSGKKAIIRNIYFDFHSFGLKQGYDHVLEHIYDVLKASPDLKIEISGHTCSIGSDETNQYISSRRAEVVKSELIKLGISSDRLITVGYGSTQPLASNDDEEDGRELNRRIEVKVLD